VGCSIYLFISEIKFLKMLHYHVNFEVFQSPRFEKKKKRKTTIFLSIHELKVGSQNVEGCSYI
jgi:hypothetical protein